MTRRKPCIALMGEFSAGKTTLINFLLGEDILPTQVTATHAPPVWISHGNDAPYYLDSDNERHPVALSELQSLPVERVRYIRVWSQAEILETMDLIDTPGISDPNIPEFHRETAIENGDAAIWCTHATQAWRESERSAWMTVPEPMRARSILLATRSDKLSERERERVRKRLTREAGGDFATIIMFSATDAILAAQDEELADLFASCGARALLDTLYETAVAIAAEPDAEPAPPEAPVALIRPTRVRRSDHMERERISPENAERVRSRVLLDDESQAVASSLRQVFAEAPPETPPVAQDETDATEGADGATDDLSPPEAPAAPLLLGAGDNTVQMRTAEMQADAGEPDEPDELAEPDEPDMSSENDETPGAIPLGRPVGALQIWRQVLSQRNIETTADVVQAFEDFIEAMEAHGLFVPAPENPDPDRAENSGWRIPG